MNRLTYLDESTFLPLVHLQRLLLSMNNLHCVRTEIFLVSLNLNTIDLFKNNIAHIVLNSVNESYSGTTCLGYHAVCSVGKTLDHILHHLQWVSTLTSPCVSHCSAVITILNGLSQLKSYVHNCSLSHLDSIFMENFAFKDSDNLFYRTVIQLLSNGTVPFENLKQMYPWMTNVSCNCTNSPEKQLFCLGDSQFIDSMAASVKTLNLAGNKVGVMTVEQCSNNGSLLTTGFT